MRLDPVGSTLDSRLREPRIVIAIIFDVASIYLTSRTGLTNVPGSVLQGCITRLGTISQRLDPKTGRVTIGAFSFEAVDLNGTLSGYLDTQLNTNNQGIRNLRVRVYTGDTDNFTDGTWTQVGTYIASGNVSFSKGLYRFNCTGLHANLKKRLFRPARTRLTSTLELDDIVLQVDSTADFNLIEHTASFSHKPLQTVAYVSLPSGEIIAYSNKIPGQFQGIEREVQSIAELVEVEATDDFDRRPEVVEWPYFEMPGPQLLYSILTGSVLDTSITLPDNMHLGIATSDVDADSFRDIGLDLYDPDDPDGGRVFRFIHLKEVDGKRWLEEQLCFPMQCFLTETNDGKFRLRRRTRLIADSSTVAKITAGPDIKSHSSLTHRPAEVVNKALIRWNWDGDRHTRIEPFISLPSIAEHQEAGFIDYSFDGLVVTRHTAFTIRNVFDAIVEQYGAPPLAMSAKVSSAFNNLEVGDAVRVVDPGTRNYATGGTLDQAFEIISVSIDWLTGDVNLALRGSTAQTLPAVPEATALTALDDTWYESEGTELSTVLTISGGVITANGSLTGHADLNDPSAIYYHEGDLTLQDGVTLDWTHNIQLRINGTFHHNGTLDGAGAGPAGLNSPDTIGLPPTVASIPHQGSGMGRTLSSDGIRAVSSSAVTNFRGISQQGVYDAIPRFDLRVEDGVLKGLPTDLRGVRGGYGQSVVDSGGLVIATGGTGGDGGGGLAMICRGYTTGLSAELDVSGAPGNAPGAAVAAGGVNVHAGAGAGGAPGAFLLVFDQLDQAPPDFADFVVASQGATPQTGTPGEWEAPGKLKFSSTPGTGVGAGLGGEDHFLSHSQAIWLSPERQLLEGVKEKPPKPFWTQIVGNQIGITITVQAIPEADYDRVEVWGSITTARTDAIRLFTGRGPELIVGFPSRQTYYIWLRTIKGSRASDWDKDDGAGTKVSGGGQPIAPISLSDIFAETFDAYTTQEDLEQDWEIVSGSPTITFPFNGETGGRACRISGAAILAWRHNIPFDAVSALYRMEARFRTITADDGNQTLDIGLYGVKADGETIINDFGTTSKTSFRRLLVSGLLQDEQTLNEWQRTMTWVAGTNEDASTINVQPAAGAEIWNNLPRFPWLLRRASDDDSAPRYMRPAIRVNWTGVGVSEIDSLFIRYRPIDSVGQVAIQDQSISTVDDEEFWNTFRSISGSVGGLTLQPSTFEVGGGLDNKNCILFDIDGLVRQTVSTRFPVLLTGNTITVRVQYRITGTVVGVPDFRCTLQGYRRDQYQRAWLTDTEGSVIDTTAFSSLTADGNWNTHTWTFSNVLSGAMADADVFDVEFEVDGDNASDDFQLRLGRARLAQA